MWKHVAPLRILKNTFLASVLWGSVCCPTADRQPADCDRVCLCNAVCLSSQEEVMVLERILLQTIKFDLQVDHPYQFLLRYAKQLKGIYVCLFRFSEAN